MVEDGPASPQCALLIAGHYMPFIFSGVCVSISQSKGLSDHVLEILYILIDANSKTTIKCLNKLLCVWTSHEILFLNCKTGRSATSVSTIIIFPPLTLHYIKQV